MGLHLVSRILSLLHHADAEIGGNFEHSFSKQGLERHIVNAENTVNTKEIVKRRDKVCALRIHAAGMSNKRLLWCSLLGNRN